MFTLHLYLCWADWNQFNHIVIIVWISLMSNKSVEHRKTSLLSAELELRKKLCWKLDIGLTASLWWIIHNYLIVSELQRVICWHMFTFQGTVRSKFLEINLHPNLRRLGVYLAFAKIHLHSKRLVWKPWILVALSTMKVLSLKMEMWQQPLFLHISR